MLHRLSLELGDPPRRDAALDELRALADAARDRPEGAPLRLAVVEAAVGAAQERLELSTQLDSSRSFEQGLTAAFVPAARDAGV